MARGKKKGKVSKGMGQFGAGRSAGGPMGQFGHEGKKRGGKKGRARGRM